MPLQVVPVWRFPRLIEFVIKHLCFAASLRLKFDPIPLVHREPCVSSQTLSDTPQFLRGARKSRWSQRSDWYAIGAGAAVGLILRIAGPSCCGTLRL